MTFERSEPNTTAGEREMLEGWLDYHRATLMWKCEGLTPEQLRSRTCPPSKLTLLGLARHMTEVEWSWFQFIFTGAPEAPIYYSEEKPDDDFDDLESAEPSEVFERFTAECERSREVWRAASLDEIGKNASSRSGNTFSMRWIMTHMIEEYARHNGHADLLREAIDGQTGD